MSEPATLLPSLAARSGNGVAGRKDRPLRVLIASHGHPGISNGGAEIAAWQLYEHLAAHSDVEAWFLGCDRKNVFDRAGAAITEPLAEGDFVYAAGEFDWFRFANRDSRFPDAFESLLKELAPDIVHFHHYAVLGVEAFAHVKRALPEAKIVLTLHEFLAICNHYGQMVKRPGGALCYKSSSVDCSRCFPERDLSQWFLRKIYIERFFSLVDRFIAPSHFLAERYREYGLPEAKLCVIENLVRSRDGPPPQPMGAAPPLRIGFFGQLSWLKGSDVLLDAAEMLEDQKERLVFDIFGDYRNQPVDFQEKFVARLAAAGRNVRFHGPYDQAQTDRLMQSVHAVVVPSVWWENSPLVIQEALRNQRPIICSDIGGMREKVRDGVDGLHFTAGDALALSSVLRDVLANPNRLSELAATMQSPPPPAAIRDSHLALYGQALSNEATTAAEQ